jgi:hypothetical protein
MASKPVILQDGVILGDGSNVQIKCKKLTGTTGAAEGNQTDVAHGLDSSKIIGMQCLVSVSSATNIPPAFPIAEYQYSINFDATNFSVQLSATSSGSILSKGFVALIFYTV